MHDGSEIEEHCLGNQTLELTRVLLDTLLQVGYRFVRLDELPQVQSAVLGTARPGAVHQKLG